MSVKVVNEYVPEMCDVCHTFTYGVFVELHTQQICKDCCKEINKQLQIYELEKE